MKNKNLIQNNLLLIVLLSVLMLTTTTQVFSQSNDDEDEESVDDMNTDRFGSNYDNSYQTQKPYYQNVRSGSGSDQVNKTINDLDIEVHHRTYNGNGDISISVGNGPTGNTTPSNTKNAEGVVGMPNITRLDPNNTSSPDNPPDPDAPIDGGVSLLIAAGVGYGLYKRKKA